ncbi:MAG: hypothetical protein SGJ13_00220, partial [Actinomycetota bacterium]|nr:hypothetical protein [Actinomycetota bacterium]
MLGPSLPSGAMARPRLLDVVRRRFDVGVVAIVAGAGFGKTTLLAQAFADNLAEPRGMDLWLPCGPADATASRLTARLAALLGIEPPAPESAVGILLGALAARAEIPTCVVVDDAHELQSDSGGSQLLQALLSRAPETTHFVVASRTPVDGLARRRAHGAVVELGADDLRLTTAEAGDLDRSHAVGDELGGWPALVALAVKFGPAAAHEFAREEVLDALDTNQRRALAALAAIGGGDRSVCAAVVGDVGLDELLAGLPLVTVGDDVIAVHGLWNRMLSEVLSVDERRHVCRIAAAHWLELGDTQRAFDLARNGGDDDTTLRAIRELCRRGYGVAPRDVLEAMRERLPSHLADEPEARLLAGMVARIADPFSEAARDDLETAMLAFRERGDVVTELAAASELAWVARSRGEQERVMPLLQRAFALEAEGHDAVRGTCRLARGMLADLSGDDVQAYEAFGGVENGSVSPEWHTVADFMTMMTAFHLGEPDAMIDAATTCVARAGGAYSYQLVVPCTTWQAGRPADVPAELPPLPDLARASGTDRLWGGVATAIVEAGRGNVDQARRAQALAEDALGATALPYLRGMLTAARASTAVAAGDDDDARAALDAFLAECPPTLPAASRSLRWAFVVAYVLSDEMREVWDAAPLGPLHAARRTVARALMAVRAGQPLPGVDDWPPAPLIASSAPGRWIALLANALDAQGRTVEARDLAGLLAPAARDPLTRGLRVATTETVVGIALFGPTALTMHDKLVDAPHWRRRRVRELLAFVAHHGSVARERVLAALWPDLADADARRNLRVTLTYLQALLEPDRPREQAPFYLRMQNDFFVLLGPPQVTVDVQQFETAAATADAA